MKKRREVQAHSTCGHRFGWSIFTSPGTKGPEDEELHRAVMKRVRESLAPFDPV